MAIETSFLNNIAAGKGCKYFDSQDIVTGLKFQSLVIQEDTVIEEAYDNNGLDLVAYWGVASKTLKQGAFLSIPLNTWIEQLELTSGSVIGYNA